MCSSKNWKLFKTDAEKLKGGASGAFPIGDARPGIPHGASYGATTAIARICASLGVGQDRSFILGALGVPVIAHGDGTWDLELEVPHLAAPPAQDVQIENTGPRLG